MSSRAIGLTVLVFALAVGAGLGLRWLGKAALGEPCDTDGDCREAGAICLQTYRDRTCTRRCESDADCPQGQLCREADLHDETNAPTDTSHLVCASPAPTIDTFRALGETGGQATPPDPP